jgi:uncharacterized protein YggE
MNLNTLLRGCVFALLSCLPVSFVAQASPLPDFPFVAVTGSASQQVAPDQARLTFSLSTFDQNSDVAQARLNNTANAVLALLKKHGIAQTQITAFELDKSEKRRRDEQYNQLDVLGYDLRRRFLVRLNDLHAYPALMTQLYALNGVHELSTEFDISTRDSTETALVAAAAADARKKANQLAEGLGVKIHSVFAFNDSGSFPSFFATFGFAGQASNRNRVAAGAMADSAGEPAVLIPQSIEVSKTVNVIYKITP